MLHLQQYLQKRLAHDETVSVVLDEAQNLDERTLEDLGRLFALETPAVKMLQLTLVGHPDLDLKLNSDKLRPLNKRIALRCRIRPMDRNEGREYLKYRLKLAGRDFSEVFTSEAANRVLGVRRGNSPGHESARSRAFSIGYHHSSPVIDSQIVQEAMQGLLISVCKNPGEPIRLFRGKKQIQGRSDPVSSLLLLVFLLSLSLVLSLFFRK